jgi:hypothetical protein
MPKKARKFLFETDATVATIHNHTLLQTVAEVNTNASLRCIPAELEGFAEHLSQVRLSSYKIFLALTRQCEERGLPISFTWKDVNNKYVAESSGEKALDCSNLIEYLNERQSEDDSLPFSFRLSQDGTLDCVFFVMRDGMERWKRSQTAVLLCDTKHGTNRYGHKLGCLTYIDETGRHKC